MAHGELFVDLHRRYRWIVYDDEGGVEVSQVSYATPEEAYAAAMDLPLTIVNQVRDGDDVHEVVYEHALRVRNGDSTPEPQIVRLIDRLRQ